MAWLAGLFEGEGCVFIRKSDGRAPLAQVTISMTDEDVIRKAASVAGLGSVCGPFGPYTTPRKPLWKWQVARFEEAQAILGAMYPWLHSRRQAKIREVLGRLRDAPKPKNYGMSHACGRRHLRSEYSYRNERGNWVCRACRQENEKRAREEGRRGSRREHLLSSAG